jgi:hypothetical protein
MMNPAQALLLPGRQLKYAIDEDPNLGSIYAVNSLMDAVSVSCPLWVMAFSHALV